MREVLESLVATYPALRERIFDGDELPQFLNVFIDGSDVRLFDGLETTVADGRDRDPAARRRRRRAWTAARPTPPRPRRLGALDRCRGSGACDRRRRRRLRDCAAAAPTRWLCVSVP